MIQTESSLRSLSLTSLRGKVIDKYVRAEAIFSSFYVIARQSDR